MNPCVPTALDTMDASAERSLSRDQVQTLHVQISNVVQTALTVGATSVRHADDAERINRAGAQLDGALQRLYETIYRLQAGAAR